MALPSFRNTHVMAGALAAAYWTMTEGAFEVESHILGWQSRRMEGAWVLGYCGASIPAMYSLPLDLFYLREK